LAQQFEEVRRDFMKKKVFRGARSFMGFGSTATPTTSIEVEVPKTDPTVERTAQLKTRAQEILAENARLAQEEEERKHQAAIQRRDKTIKAVKRQCKNEWEWKDVVAMVEDKSLGWMPDDLATGRAYEIALGQLRGER
jgi:hypothetical protein